MVNTIKRAARIAAKRVPFFDLEYAMKYQGYVHEPRTPYCKSSNEPTNCAVYFQALREHRGDQAKPCAIQCNLCKHVCETTDYIRGTGKAHYPMPAIRDHDALHLRYPRVLSEQDRVNAANYFWQVFHRRYG